MHVFQDSYMLSVQVFKILNFNWQTYIDRFIKFWENTLVKILNIEQFTNINVWNSTQQM